MSINATGIKFIHDRSTRMAVNSMDAAAKAIGTALRDRQARIDADKPLESDLDFDKVGRHLAWIVGFDHLIQDRNTIRDLTEKVI